jgi:hypothetical protein
LDCTLTHLTLPLYFLIPCLHLYTLSWHHELQLWQWREHNPLKLVFNHYTMQQPRNTWIQPKNQSINQQQNKVMWKTVIFVTSLVLLSYQPAWSETEN